MFISQEKKSLGILETIELLVAHITWLLIFSRIPLQYYVFLSDNPNRPEAQLVGINYLSSTVLRITNKIPTTILPSDSLGYDINVSYNTLPS